MIETTLTAYPSSYWLYYPLAEDPWVHNPYTRCSNSDWRQLSFVEYN